MHPFPPTTPTTPTTLAQALNPLIVTDPPPLPSPPLLERALFENPWPLALVLLAAGLLAWYVLTQRAHLRVARAVILICILAAAGVVALARLVTTTRETLDARTRDFVRAVATADTIAARTILTNDAALYWWIDPNGLPLDLLLARIERDFREGGSYRVAEHQVLSVQASVDSPTTARVQVKVRVVAAAANFPNISWWRLDYVREGDAWRVDAIQPLAISGVSNPGAR